MKKLIIVLLVLSLIIFACKKNESPAEPEPAPADTPVDTSTPTVSGTPTETFTITETPTETGTPLPLIIDDFEDGDFTDTSTGAAWFSGSSGCSISPIRGVISSGAAFGSYSGRFTGQMCPNNMGGLCATYTGASFVYAALASPDLSGYTGVQLSYKMIFNSNPASITCEGMKVQFTNSSGDYMYFTLPNPEDSIWHSIQLPFSSFTVGQGTQNGILSTVNMIYLIIVGDNATSICSGCLEFDAVSTDGIFLDGIQTYY